MSIPLVVLILLVWNEKSVLGLVYLVSLSMIFSIYGMPETIIRIYIHRSTLNGLSGLLIAELLLLLPIVVKALSTKICANHKHP